MIFATVLVLKIRPSRAKVFVFVEVLQFVLRELVNDTPDLFRFVTQNVCDATSPPARPKGKGQPM